MKIRSFSAAENELITRLEFEGKEIYARADIISFSLTRQKGDYLIKKLLEKKRLRTIIRNVYLFVPTKAPAGQWAGNEYLIAQALARDANYYIGYSSVFNSYGFTDQVAQVIHIINNKYSGKKIVLGVTYKLVKVLTNRLYGLEKRKIKNEDIVFPQKERALIDVFEFYDTYRAFDILKKQMGQFNLPLFVKYAACYPVQIVRRRIGYFLEQLKVNNRLLSTINVGKKGYSPLFGDRSAKGRINKKWRVIVDG
jgi:predicted transcriptional regulator of viral defense system